MAFQLDIPQTILHQLGGANRLNAMLGVKRFLSCENETALAFKIANFSGIKINYIKIKLNGLDLYDIELGRIWGSKYKKIQSIENIYAEDLIETLERKTGLAFRL